MSEAQRVAVAPPGSASLHPLFTTYPDLGFALVPVPRDAKGPTLRGWQALGVSEPAQVARWWGTSSLNVGLLHAPSRTAALDLDHPEHAATALRGVGIDLPGLLAAPGVKVRTAKGFKPIYRLPEGCARLGCAKASSRKSLDDGTAQRNNRSSAR